MILKVRVDPRITLVLNCMPMRASLGGYLIVTSDLLIIIDSPKLIEMCVSYESLWRCHIFKPKSNKVLLLNLFEVRTF